MKYLSMNLLHNDNDQTISNSVRPSGILYLLQDDSSIPVKQFQYTGWPEEGVPDVGSGLIDVIGQVQKWQRSSGDRPVVVHCRLLHNLFDQSFL